MQDEINAALRLILIDKEKNLYKFGTKRVTVKEMNGKLWVRVGGGYMEYTEFYKIYSEQEMAKMEREEEDRRQSMSPEPEANKGKGKGKKKKKKKKAAANVD